MSTLDELTTPLTRDEARDAIYAAIASLGVDVTSWKPGAAMRATISGVAIVLSALSKLQALIAASGFLARAEGDWLTLVAKYVYGVDRIEGTFATGNVTLTNGGGGVFAIGVGDLVVAHEDTGKTYRNTAAFTLHASETLDIAVQADELGSASTATPDKITEFVTTLLQVTVTNESSLVGLDEEDDQTLRLRCAEKLGTLSPNGPRDAYAFIARSATRADGTSIGVTRVKTVADGAGNLTVYVADDDGPITGTVGDLDTDLGRVDDAIQRLAAPLAVAATTVSASAHLIAITYSLWIRDTTGASNSDIQDAIALKLTEYLATSPIGGHVISPATGTIYKSTLEAVIGSVYPAETLKITVSVPAGDVSIADSEAPVVGTLTPTITQVHEGTI